VGQDHARPELGELVVHPELEEPQGVALAQAVTERHRPPVHPQVHQPQQPGLRRPAGALGVEADARGGGEDRRPGGELPRPGLEPEALVEPRAQAAGAAVVHVEDDLAGVGHPVPQPAQPVAAVLGQAAQERRRVAGRVDPRRGADRPLERRGARPPGGGAQGRRHGRVGGQRGQVDGGARGEEAPGELVGGVGVGQDRG
jgi:hypothetical protein